MNEIVVVEQLRKSFPVKGRTVEAVRGLDLAVREGEVFAFLGPNGAGKTTTLRMLTTLLAIDAGRAERSSPPPKRRSACRMCGAAAPTPAHPASAQTAAAPASTAPAW